MSFKSVKLVFEKEIEIVEISGEVIELSNGDLIKHDYSPLCCEYNYADFRSLEDTTIIGQKFNELVFEKSEYGFLLNGHLVNCYSEQNGYYSQDVDIIYHPKNSYQGIKVLNVDCDLKEW